MTEGVIFQKFGKVYLYTEKYGNETFFKLLCKCLPQAHFFLRLTVELWLNIYELLKRYAFHLCQG